MRYTYGMRLRPAGPGAQPKEGLQEIKTDPKDEYWDLLVYDRELSEKEIHDYELRYLGKEE